MTAKRPLRAAGLSLRTALDIGAASGPGFNGQFAALFPGAYQVVQTDLGLTYGGTMLAAGTAPPVITLTGSLAGVPVPILVSETLAGILGTWQGSVSYNNGADVAQTFTSATTVPLNGKGTGLTLNIAAGASATGNTWTATCAGLADQSGNLKHYSQATASKQPVITVGLNGKAGILGDGVDDTLVSLLNMPAPATTPWSLLIVAKNAISGVNARCFSPSSGNTPGIVITVTPTIVGQSGGPVNLSTWSTSQYSAITAYFSGSNSDSLRIGSAAAVSGATATGGATIGRELFSAVNASFSTFQLLALIYAPGNVSDAAFRAAVNSVAGYGVGNVLV